MPDIFGNLNLEKDESLTRCLSLLPCGELDTKKNSIFSRSTFIVVFAKRRFTDQDRFAHYWGNCLASSGLEPNL